MTIREICEWLVEAHENGYNSFIADYDADMNDNKLSIRIYGIDIFHEICIDDGYRIPYKDIYNPRLTWNEILEVIDGFSRSWKFQA